MTHPKLRPLQPTPVTHGGQAGFVLRDPLTLSDQVLFLPRELSPLLALCDGTRDLSGLRAALMVRFGVRVSLDALTQLIAQFDAACLLDNERFAAARDEALATYRDAPFRPPALAGNSYPAEPDRLAAYLTGFDTGLPSEAVASESDADVRGVVVPHIDYQRGGRVYAGLWRRAAEAVRQAELIVVLGTDHHGGSLLTLTRQHYATPWGVLPTARDAVDALAEAVGEERAFRDELHHRAEHAIELTVVWMHAVLGDHTPELVPILTGSFQRFVDDGVSPDSQEELAAAVAALREIAAQRRTLVVAAADLAHMGPAFGGQPLDQMRRAMLRGDDERLLESVCQGNAEAFFGQIKAEGDRRNICGLPPIYLTLRILDRASGQVTGYEICPADRANTSSVSVAGVLLW
ncbi:MAG: AmmeMemoRadiSam system protein B [Anaerolineae bacterium]|nr:MAG: AmmeMemoRadiSam system protein B [Anaerolineae bacterium]